MRNNALLGMVLLVVALTPLAEGHPPTPAADSTSYEQQLEEGLDAFYRSDWSEARSIFQDLQTDHPKDSRAYFFNAMIPFWKYYFGDNAQQSADEFLDQSQTAIEISKARLDENSRDTTMVLMLSGLYGYRSLVSASEKEYKDALQSGVTGFKYTRQLLSLDSDDPNALIGKGMFYYMVGSVPDGLKWVTNAVGVSGDMQEGFDALEKVAQTDSYISNDARMILAYLYEREDQTEKALHHLNELTQRYPQNIIFQYNRARILEKDNQLTEAREKYELVSDMDTQELEKLRQKSEDRLKQF
ncbi:MAG: tetratricopeptide repeat protein [Bacteroidota bacterium]